MPTSNQPDPVRNALLPRTLLGCWMIVAIAPFAVAAAGCDDVDSLSAAYVPMDDEDPCDKGPNGRYCNSACVDELSDVKNCGGCNHACAGGTTCTSGACVCSSGKSLCGGTCSDTASDIHNCGGCGKACAAGAGATVTCVKSQCQLGCAAGQADCDKNAATGCEVTLATDDGNCGLCGHSCGGAGCTNGVCNPSILQSGLLTLSAMTADGNGSLFYATAGTGAGQGTIRSVATTGTAAAAMLVTGETSPKALQVSGHHLAWITPTSIQAADTTNLMGGTSTQVLLINAVDLALNGTVAFYADNTGAVGSVDVVAKMNTALVAARGARRVVADATSLYFIATGNSGDTIFSIAQTNPQVPLGLTSAPSMIALGLDGTTVYFTTSPPGTMMGTVGKVDTSGANSSSLATGRDHPGAIVANSGEVYVVEANSQVVRFTNNGMTTVTPVALSTGTIDFIAVDVLGLYYSDRDANGSFTIYKAQR